jgi:hypothetical protein
MSCPIVTALFKLDMVSADYPVAQYQCLINRPCCPAKQRLGSEHQWL